MELVKKLFDNNIPQIDINKIYTYGSFITVDNTSKGEQYNLTYGELTQEGMNNIIDKLKSINIKISTFIDLGSGNGKTLVLAIMNGFEYAKGVEIVEERHDFAVSVKMRLPDYYRKRIELISNDLFALDSNFFPNNTVIFISNLLFPEKTQENIFKFLSKITNKGTILITSKKPDNIYNFKLIDKLKVPMSWDSDSECFIFIK